VLSFSKSCRKRNGRILNQADSATEPSCTVRWSALEERGASRGETRSLLPVDKWTCSPGKACLEAAETKRRRASYPIANGRGSLEARERCGLKILMQPLLRGVAEEFVRKVLGFQKGGRYRSQGLPCAGACRSRAAGLGGFAWAIVGPQKFFAR